MTTIYLSGPISLGGSLDKEAMQARIDVFACEEERLQTLGYSVENPCRCKPQPDWAAYMRIHIPTVCRVDLVALLPDWQQSRGSVLEVFVATSVGVAVATADSILRGPLEHA